MEFPGEDGVLLHEWQKLHFATKAPAVHSNIEQRIQSQRSALFLLNGARASVYADDADDDPQGYYGAVNDTLNTYHTLVDNNPVDAYTERVAMRLPKDNAAIKTGIIDVKSTITWETIQQIHPFLKECTNTGPNTKQLKKSTHGNTHKGDSRYSKRPMCYTKQGITMDAKPPNQQAPQHHNTPPQRRDQQRRKVREQESHLHQRQPQPDRLPDHQPRQQPRPRREVQNNHHPHKERQQQHRQQPPCSPQTKQRNQRQQQLSPENAPENEPVQTRPQQQQQQHMQRKHEQTKEREERQDMHPQPQSPVHHIQQHRSRPQRLSAEPQPHQKTVVCIDVDGDMESSHTDATEGVSTNGSDRLTDDLDTEGSQLDCNAANTRTPSRSHNHAAQVGVGVDNTLEEQSHTGIRRGKCASPLETNRDSKRRTGTRENSDSRSEKQLSAESGAVDVRDDQTSGDPGVQRKTREEPGLKLAPTSGERHSSKDETSIRATERHSDNRIDKAHPDTFMQSQHQDTMTGTRDERSTRISTARHLNKLYKHTSDTSSNRTSFDKARDRCNQRSINCDDVIEHSQDAVEMIYSQETHQMEPRKCKSFRTMGEGYEEGNRDRTDSLMDARREPSVKGPKSAFHNRRALNEADNARDRDQVVGQGISAPSATTARGYNQARDTRKRAADDKTHTRNAPITRNGTRTTTTLDDRAQDVSGTYLPTNNRNQSSTLPGSILQKGDSDNATAKGNKNRNGNDNASVNMNTFKTAGMLHQANIKNGITRAPHNVTTNSSSNNANNNNGLSGKRTLGGRRNGNNKFVPPLLRNGDSEETSTTATTEEVVDERLKGLDPKIVEMIMNEIMDSGPGIGWEDIAGLKHAKKTILEIVVWPLLRPDIFTGLRGPPKGILLFGPPGTGKTLIGKCIASQSKATFFSISASSLTSKWVGEGEKMVRALFAVARIHQPAVIFVDEIDSLLSARSSTEHESSRRIKTEFLVQLDGAATSADDRILLVGATNLPQEIDDAARRRMVKRLYIPLPDKEGRQQLFDIVLASQAHNLSTEELEELVQKTKGYSGSDISNLCKEAALGPIRNIEDICNVTADQVRPMSFCDFEEALTQVRASVSQSELDMYVQWNNNFGSLAVQPS